MICFIRPPTLPEKFLNIRTMMRYITERSYRVLFQHFNHFWFLELKDICTSICFTRKFFRYWSSLMFSINAIYLWLLCCYCCWYAFEFTYLASFSWIVIFLDLPTFAAQWRGVLCVAGSFFYKSRSLHSNLVTNWLIATQIKVY